MSSKHSEELLNKYFISLLESENEVNNLQKIRNNNK